MIYAISIFAFIFVLEVFVTDFMTGIVEWLLSYWD